MDRKLPVKVSVILPVRNEENLILFSIQRIKESASLLPIEIIVVDGGSADRTEEFAKKSADHVIRSPKACRSFQMHLGAQAAQGEFFVFLHVDSQLPCDWQNILLNTFCRNSHRLAALSFHIQFDSEKVFFKIFGWLANLRAQLTHIPHGDQGLIVPREIYFSAGGYPDVPLMEEYLFVQRLKKFGNILIHSAATMTSTRRYATNGPIRNSLKNLIFIFLFYLGISPKKLAQWYWRTSPM